MREAGIVDYVIVLRDGAALGIYARTLGHWMALFPLNWLLRHGIKTGRLEVFASNGDSEAFGDPGATPHPG